MLKRPSSKSWRNLLRPLQVKILMNAQRKQKPGAGCAQLQKNLVVLRDGYPGGLKVYGGWCGDSKRRGEFGPGRSSPLRSGAAKRDQHERGGGGNDGVTLVYPFLLKD